MNKRFLHISLASFFLVFSLIAAAQQQGKNIAYVFTYTIPGSMSGTSVKMIDLNTGQITGSVFEDKQYFQIMNARSGKLIRNSAQLFAADSLLQPMATSVAAAAYDEKHNRLFFTPMGINQLRYIDLNKKVATFNYVQDQQFGIARGMIDVPGQLTRMVIDANGIGYALSNDANHFLRFTTDANMTITDLGAIKDDPSKVSVSLHSFCTSAGGDMVLDGSGNLLLVSANNYVFSIDINTQTASYKGLITGLPAGFTSNGAAVNSNGELVVSSATGVPANAYYKVDVSSLKATKINSIGSAMINGADMANANILGQQAIETKSPGAAITGKSVVLYPNPVKEGFFKLTFSNLQKGDYELQVLDLLGTLVNTQSLTIHSNQQVERIDVSSFKAQGMYLVRLVDKDKVVQYSNKIIIVKD